MKKNPFPENFSELPDIRYAAVVDFNLNHRNEWHNSLRNDLIYIISGNLTVVLPGAVELQYPASTGDVLMMQGNLSHKDLFKTGKGLKAMILSYFWKGDKDFFSIGKGFSIHKFESCGTPEIRWQLEKMRESLKINKSFVSNPLLLNSRLHTILLLLYNILQGDENCENVPTDKLEALLRDAEHYINCNYTTPTLSRHEVATALNVSVPTLARAFERFCGYTFVEYLTQVRLEAAKKLLHDGKYRISETAQLCGFSDPSYFARVFKKTFGISPRKYS